MTKSLQYYLNLQLKRGLRKSAELGIPGIVGIPAIALALVAFALWLCYQTPRFAPYLLWFFSIGLILPLHNRDRVTFLKTVFPEPAFRLIRILENGIYILPFAIILLIQQYYVHVGILAVLAVLMATISIQHSFKRALPTPFLSIPFEHIVGFRRYLGLFILGAFLSYKGIAVDNFNLSLSGLVLAFLASMTFYATPEKAYYVWIFKHSPHGFLVFKCRQALLGSSISSIPFLIVLGSLYADKIWILLCIQAVGYAVLMAVVLAKYAAFPNEISVPQAILLVLSLAFPPFLIVAYSRFYHQAKQNLSILSHDPYSTTF
ncbi:MAG: hypothetical protein AAF705_13480 [Bacteroidota bacterium]